jgi:hypothetical protein
MAAPVKPAYKELVSALRKTLTASDAVREGIATHAEKHKADQHKARETAAAQARLKINPAAPR